MEEHLICKHHWKDRTCCPLFWFNAAEFDNFCQRICSKTYNQVHCQVLQYPWQRSPREATWKDPFFSCFEICSIHLYYNEYIQYKNKLISTTHPKDCRSLRHSMIVMITVRWKVTCCPGSKRFLSALQLVKSLSKAIIDSHKEHVDMCWGSMLGWQLSSCSMSWHVFTVFRPGWCPNAHRHGLSHFIPQELLYIDRIFGDIAICAYFIEIYTHCMNYCKLSIVRFLVFYSVESTNFWSPLLHRHTLHFLKPFE